MDMEISQHYYLAKAFKIPAKPPHAFGPLMSRWEERELLLIMPITCPTSSQTLVQEEYGFLPLTEKGL